MPGTFCPANPAGPAGALRKTSHNKPPSSGKLWEFLLSQEFIFVAPRAAAVLLGLSIPAINRMLLDGRLPSRKFGKSRRIPVATIQQWADETTGGAAR